MALKLAGEWVRMMADWLVNSAVVSKGVEAVATSVPDLVGDLV
jgi:hypothetical protein